jgi:hypothetical protein
MKAAGGYVVYAVLSGILLIRTVNVLDAVKFIRKQVVLHAKADADK